jgi:hypothetical protein
MQFLHLISYIAALRNSKNQPQPALTSETRIIGKKLKGAECDAEIQFAFSTFDGVCAWIILYICSVANTCITLSSAAVQQPACVCSVILWSIWLHHSWRKNESGRERERDRDGLTQKERKVSVILIALVPSSISIVVVKVIYFFVCVKFRYEKKSFFAVRVYISWPALFFSFDFSSLLVIYLKRGRHQKIS